MRLINHQKDYYNRKKLRNEKNTKSSSYNCGGYALRTFSWLQMDAQWEIPVISYLDMLLESYNLLDETVEELIESYTLEEMVFSLLEEYPSLKRISQKEIDRVQLTENQELVAFRIYVNIDEEHFFDEDIDYDFHFKVKRNGKWKHKRGGNEIEETDCTNIAPWDNLYGSEVIYFINNF